MGPLFNDECKQTFVGRSISANQWLDSFVSRPPGSLFLSLRKWFHVDGYISSLPTFVWLENSDTFSRHCDKMSPSEQSQPWLHFALAWAAKHCLLATIKHALCRELSFNLWKLLCLFPTSWRTLLMIITLIFSAASVRPWNRLQRYLHWWVSSF